MPTGFLCDAERERLDSFPAQVVAGDIEAYFALSRADRRPVPRTASPANRLGLRSQLRALEFLGFCPDDLSTAPEAVIAFVSRQLDVAPGELARYGRRGQTRTEHRLSPARSEHINPYGKYRFEVEEGLSRTRLRPLRPPAEHPSG